MVLLHSVIFPSKLHSSGQEREIGRCALSGLKTTTEQDKAKKNKNENGTDLTRSATNSMLQAEENNIDDNVFSLCG